MDDSFETLSSTVVSCERCRRLRIWSETAVGQQARYREQPYWAKPVFGFGDVNARLVVIGLAPGRHGANRTGRPFTGDAAGQWLYQALFQHGYSNQPEAWSREDGLALRDVYITNLVRCAPPGDKPSREEIAACVPYLHQEMRFLTNCQGVLALGRVAFDGYMRWVMGEKRHTKRPVFEHGRVYHFEGTRPWVLASYHCSQRNTRSGRLTPAMWEAIFGQVAQLLGTAPTASEPR